MLDISKEKGVPLEEQQFDWQDMVRVPTSKLDDDAMTRVRIILMNGIESNALRTQHAFARMNSALRIPLARIRRVEQHQQTMVNWLLPADLTPIETTIGFEQAAIEVTASVAQHEPNEYMAQTYRFGLLEDFDHLYRFSALMDRVFGMDPNTILQNYTDVMPGRPTSVEHRAPEDDIREHYDRQHAAPLTKLNATTITASEQQAREYYMTIGPMFADPLARQLYAEIASIEEQHVTQYESLFDPGETMLERWLLHEVAEIYNYYSCLQYETNPRIKAVWERFVDYEIGHFQFVRNLVEKMEKRDVSEIVPLSLPEPIEYRRHRDFVRQVLANEVDLRAMGAQFIHKNQETKNSPSAIYRRRLNSKGSPSDVISAGYRYKPGTEIATTNPLFDGAEEEVA